MARIRQDLGVCPQFDILWPEMTVLEHLLLHGAIKGFSGTDRLEVAEAAAQDVGECDRGHSAQKFAAQVGSLHVTGLLMCALVPSGTGSLGSCLSHAGPVPEIGVF